MKGLGSWSFIVGLIVAIIVAIFAYDPIPSWAIWLLVILGVIVGVLNVQDKEAMMFLVATVAFLLSFMALGKVFATLWGPIGAFFDLLQVFIAPAAFIVAVKSLLSITKN
ncbi:hypothetical protein JW868_02750 [Candidatus Woesearchaeota archaeon]|nr:hypothetical protein [Candidatus Woesearchaeota archaeon]